MQFKDQLDFVKQHIKRNRLRVFMTILAATMGTAFLIVLASVGFGLHDTLRNEMLSNRLVTEIQVHGSEDASEPEKQVETFKKMEHVQAVLNQQKLGTDRLTRFGEYEGYHEFIVSDFKEEAKVGFALKEGRLPEKSDEVVVGSHFADALYKESAEEHEPFEDNLIGQTFTLSIENADGELSEQALTLTIVGVGKEPAKEWVMDNRIFGDAALIPKIKQIFNENQQEEIDPFYNEVTVHADELEHVSQISKKIKEDGFYTYSIADELEQMDIFFLALKAGLIFVGTIAILIASIGIFNTMTMAVTERTREIGVMKAIGANPKLIQRLFVMESAWIGIVGTVIAVIISYGISMIANYLLPIIVTSALDVEDTGGFTIVFSIIPWQLIVIASFISISVAIISGWRPARKATKIDVIQALRQEL